MIDVIDPFLRRTSIDLPISSGFYEAVFFFDWNVNFFGVFLVDSGCLGFWADFYCVDSAFLGVF